MSHPLRTTATILAGVIAAAGLPMAEAAAASAASAAAQTDQAMDRTDPATSATSHIDAADDAGAAGETRIVKIGLPTNVRVTTDDRGYTVWANPTCWGAKSCRSWFKIPSAGVDQKDVTTSSGYRMSWPSNWAEDTSRTDGTVVSYGRDLFGVGHYGIGVNVASLGTITRPYTKRALTVRLTGKDDVARTASVTGTATPFASIRRGSTVVATANGSGTWSATIGGLPTGTSTLVFDQYVDTNTYVDRASVNVTIALRDLLTGVTGAATDLAPGTATTVFGTVRATAEATRPLTNATVTFTAPTGTTFASGQPRIRGQYRTSSTAPWQDFVADNLVDGTLSDGERTARYSWNPTNSDWKLAAGTEVRFGIATRNPGTAETDGTLTMRTAGTASQGSLAATATTPVHLSTPELEPVTVTGPDTVAPGVDNTFTGTATPGATFEVVDAAGDVIVPGGPFTVGADGGWRFTHRVPLGSTEFSFAIKQSKAGKEATSEVFTLRADTLRSGSIDTATMTPGTVNTFRGRGIPGATFRVLNPWGTEIVSGGPFRVGDDGVWQFDRLVSKTATEFRFTLEQTKNGVTSTCAVFVVPAA